jgi:hypothetical protein
LVRNTNLSEDLRGFASFPTLVKPSLIVAGTARTHARHIVTSPLAPEFSFKF